MREKDRSNHRKKLLLIIVLTAFLMATFTASAYVILDKMTLKMVTSYTDELAAHDMSTIDMFVSDRWKTMESVYNELCIRDLHDIDAVMDELSNKSSAKEEFDHFYLIDDHGVLYSDTKTRYSKADNPILEYFEKSDRMFVERYDDESAGHENTQEYMLYGINFKDAPLVVSDGANKVALVGLAVMNDISKIRKRLRITCFNNHGYASIIDSRGNYIVPATDAVGPNQCPNFYQLLSEREIEGTSVEQIRETIESGRALPSFWCTTPEGIRRYVSVYSIKDYSGWNFIIALDESIFSDQTKVFIQLLVSVFAVLLLIIVFIIFMTYQMRNSLRKMYLSVTDGVYNRQYYEDKLIDRYINAMAIMDLDRLKFINDSFGHIAGDLAIKEIADVIARRIGDKGEICRYGGDEFIVAFTDNLSSQEFSLILKDIRSAAEASRFADYPELSISLSVGGYYGVGTTGELPKEADKLLYKAKLTRNAVVTNVD